MGSDPTIRRRGRRKSAKPAATNGGGQVQSLTRALGLMRKLAEQRGGIALHDLAQRVGLPPSTTHRLLTTLKQNGMVADNGQGRWLVGVEAFVVGSAFVRDRNVAELARPLMQQLMRECGETVNLAIADDGQAVYLAQVECEQMMRVFSRPGVRVPMHSSAVGKVLLAAMADDEVAEILHAHGLPRITERTIDTPERLRAELAEVRRRGYAVDDEEHALGVRCVAAPIRDEHGAALAALSLSGPLPRIGDQRLPLLGSRLIDSAAAITVALGGRPAGRAPTEAAHRT